MLPTVKVQRPRAVLVDLLNDSADIFLRQLIIQLLENLPQGVSRDVSVSWRVQKDRTESISYRSRILPFSIFHTFLIVDPKSFLQLLFQCLLVLLYEEPSGQLAELAKF